jgi:hypothetical protein
MAVTAILAMGIITTGAFIIAQPGIQVITMATATTVAIIAIIIGRTMINRGLMLDRIDLWPLQVSDCGDGSRVWQTGEGLILGRCSVKTGIRNCFLLKACGSRAMKRLFNPSSR